MPIIWNWVSCRYNSFLFRIYLFHNLLSDYTTSSDTYPGFDWFATTIFFMMGGDMLRSWRWLKTFSILFSSGFLWHARLFNSVSFARYTILNHFSLMSMILSSSHIYTKKWISMVYIPSTLEQDIVLNWLLNKKCHQYLLHFECLDSQYHK